MHRRYRSGFFAASELYGPRDQTKKKSTSPKPRREANKTPAHKASDHRVEAHFQSNVIEKAPSGSAAVAAGHLNPPTPRPRGSAWGWAGYPGGRKLSVREVQYRGVETVTTTGGWGAQTVTMGLSGGALGRLAPVGRRKWKSKVFLKENTGFCRSRMLPSGSREGGLGVPGTTSGRRRAPSVCSEDDFGSSGDDLGQL